MSRQPPLKFPHSTPGIGADFQSCALGRLAPWPGSYGGRPGPPQPPANKLAPLEPLSGKTGGRSEATVGEAKQGGSGRGDNEDFFGRQTKFILYLLFKDAVWKHIWPV